MVKVARKMRFGWLTFRTYPGRVYTPAGDVVIKSDHALALALMVHAPFWP